jgi:diguanylate cyclase (GGDEF)-like protein
VSEPERFVSRAFAALFGLGGAVVLLTQLLPHAHDRVLAGMVIPGAVGLGISAGLLLWRHPAEWAMWALPPLGSVLVTAVSLSAGRDLRVTYATFYFWSVASAFYFFPRRVAVGNVPLVAILYGLAVLFAKEPLSAARYFVPMSALAVSALMIDRLNCEREKLQGELEQMVKVLGEQARTDPVTGLPNRREFEAQLGRELARAERTGQPLSVLMIDLDHFKELNDTKGHPAGDRLLSDVARAWSKRLRAGDLLVRYGGDEFAAILPDCRLNNAGLLAERLRAAVPEDQTCSVGAASRQPGESSAALIGRADDALLAAKRGGRNETRVAAGGRPLPTAL